MTRSRGPRSVPATLLVTGLLLAGPVLASCGRAEPEPAAEADAARTLSPADERTGPSDTAPPTAPSPPSPTATTATPGPASPSTDGRPRRAVVDIPAIGVVDLAVVPYRGRTDDAPGTAIQDRGLAASPQGPQGGTGPGGVGSYQVTAHRLSSTRALEQLPLLRRGDEVRVTAGGRLLVYRVTATRWTSFRSPASLRAQRAPVPGRPGVEPTRAMILLSTCATLEDHAVGNYWSDRFGNPEHRIEKVGVLDRVERLPGR